MHNQQKAQADSMKPPVPKFEAIGALEDVTVLGPLLNYDQGDLPKLPGTWPGEPEGGFPTRGDDEGFETAEEPTLLELAMDYQNKRGGIMSEPRKREPIEALNYEDEANNCTVCGGAGRLWGPGSDEQGKPCTHCEGSGAELPPEYFSAGGNANFDHLAALDPEDYDAWDAGRDHCDKCGGNHHTLEHGAPVGPPIDIKNVPKDTSEAWVTNENGYLEPPKHKAGLISKLLGEDGLETEHAKCANCGEGIYRQKASGLQNGDWMRPIHHNGFVACHDVKTNRARWPQKTATNWTREDGLAIENGFDVQASDLPFLNAHWQPTAAEFELDMGPEDPEVTNLATPSYAFEKEEDAGEWFI
jgi:hypothetical protein